MKTHTLRQLMYPQRGPLLREADGNTTQDQSPGQDAAQLQQQVVDAVDALQAAAQKFTQLHAQWLSAGGVDPQARGKDALTRRKEIAAAAVMRGISGGK